MEGLEHLWTIILAAGKGKRMNSSGSVNKVTLNVVGKPIIQRSIEILKAAGVKHIVVVVGFAKKSVLKLLDKDILAAEQKKRLGTGNAIKAALKTIPKSVKFVLVLYGDDSFMYSPQTFKNLYQKHLKSGAEITFITTIKKDAFGLGRIVRDKKGNLIGIVEEKNATENQKRIKEINLGGFLFHLDFLRKNIGKISKNKVTGEYYITEMVEIALKQNLKVETFRILDLKWRGVNTPQDLAEAEKILSS